MSCQGAATNDPGVKYNPNAPSQSIAASQKNLGVKIHTVQALTGMTMPDNIVSVTGGFVRTYSVDKTGVFWINVYRDVGVTFVVGMGVAMTGGLLGLEEGMAFLLSTLGGGITGSVIAESIPSAQIGHYIDYDYQIKVADGGIYDYFITIGPANSSITGVDCYYVSPGAVAGAYCRANN